MNNNNWDKYLDPPDEPEAEICESCGHEKEILDNFGGQRYTKCVNPFCPDKHDGIVKAMAEVMVEMEYTIRELKLKVKVYENLIKRSSDTVSTSKENKNGK